MPPTKMLNYHNWRISIKNKPFYKVVDQGGQFFYNTILKSDTWIGDNHLQELFEVDKGGKVNMVKNQDENEFRKLVEDLKKRCEKESFFRENKVKQIKKLIKNKQYNIPGRLVVEKWFPDKRVI